MLAGLNKGRGQLEQPKKTRDWKAILIIALLLVVAAEPIWLIVR
jgi:hypothetical protein